MPYNIIAAICHGGGLGRDGRIPWHVPEDLRLFAHVTKGDGRNAVVMGRKTWESLPRRPLPGRANLVLTTKADYDAGGAATVFSSMDALRAHCAHAAYATVWVAGGAQVYRSFLDAGIVHTCAITFIDAEYECDALFPPLGPEWAPRHTSPLRTASGVRAETREIVRVAPPREREGD